MNSNFYYVVGGGVRLPKIRHGSVSVDTRLLVLKRVMFEIRGFRIIKTV